MSIFIGPEWQAPIIEWERRATNEDVFEEVIKLAERSGNDLETEKESWEYEYLLDCLRTRLQKWFDEDSQ